MTDLALRAFNNQTSAFQDIGDVDRAVSGGAITTPGITRFQYLVGTSQSLTENIPVDLAVGDLFEVTSYTSGHPKLVSIWECVDSSALLPTGADAKDITGAANGSLYVHRSGDAYWKFDYVGEGSIDTETGDIETLRADLASGEAGKAAEIVFTKPDKTIIGAPFVLRSVEDRLRDRLSIRSVVATAGTGSDDTSAFQEGIDYLASRPNGGALYVPEPEDGSYYSTSALIAKSGVTVQVEGINTRIISERGTAFDNKKNWIFGGYLGNDYKVPPAYAVEPITRGSNTITFSNAGDASEFIAGDVIWIEHLTWFGTAETHPLPIFTQLNVVEAAGGGTVKLRHLIHESHADIQVKRFTRTGLTTTGGNIPLEAVRDFRLRGGAWINGHGDQYAQFAADGGIIDSEISPDVVKARRGVLYGQAFAHVTCNVQRIETLSVPIALAEGSHNTQMRAGTIIVTNATEGTLDHVIELSEVSRDCEIDVGTIELQGDVTNFIDCLTSRRHKVRVDTIIANNITRLVSFRRPGLSFGTGLSDVYGNDVCVRNLMANSVGRLVLFDGVADSIVRENRASVYSQGDVTNADPVNTIGFAENNLVRVSTPNSRAFKRLEFSEAPTVSVTSTAPYAKTVTVPAGTLRTSDALDISIKGLSGGASGGKSISIAFAGTTVFSHTILAGTQPFVIDSRLILSANGSVVATTHVVDSTVDVEEASATNIDVDANDYDLVVSVTCAAAGDSVSLRQADMTASRAHTLPV